MTKLRDPQSIPGIIKTIADLVGIEALAATCDLSVRTIYNWTDPDSGYLPNLHQAICLDAAYVATAGGEGPLARLMRDRIDARPLPVGSVENEAMDLPIIVGRIIEEVREATVTAQGGRLTSRQRADLLTLAGKAQHELDEFIASIQQDGGVVSIDHGGRVS